MIKVLFKVDHYQGSASLRIVGAELTAENVAHHIFINYDESYIQNSLKKRFLGKLPTSETKKEASLMVNKMYTEWKKYANTGYTKKELEEFETKVSVSPPIIMDIIREVLNRKV